MGKIQAYRDKNNTSFIFPNLQDHTLVIEEVNKLGNNIYLKKIKDLNKKGIVQTKATIFLPVGKKDYFITENKRLFPESKVLTSLHNTDVYCNSDQVKRAELFSAVTGFRYSDLETLTWKQIGGISGDYYILYNQQKTDSAEYYPVSDQTIALLGKPADPEEQVFLSLKYDHVTKNLPKWLSNAGISRRFTFHGFRHTFATLQIAAGTSI